MVKSVIIPLDGSELAAEALGFGETVARRKELQMHLVRVISTDAEASEEEEARTYLDEVASQIDLDCRVHIRIGNAADEIVDTADEITDSLIVMTTHGRTGIGRWWYGSVADRVMHGASGPVLLLRSGTNLSQTQQINSIMVPLDGSAYSEVALTHAKSFASAFDSELHIIRVAETAKLYSTLGFETYGPGVGAPMTEVVDKMVEDINTYCDSLTKELKEQGYNAKGVVVEGFPGEQLLAYESENQPDLVVMSTHGRSGLDRVLFGSVAERILKTGTTPVLMVKPAGVLEDANE